MDDKFKVGKIEAEFLPDDPYPFAKDADEKRRAYVYDNFTWNPECRVRGQIRALDAICNWIKDGSVPKKKPKPPSLTVLKKGL